MRDDRKSDVKVEVQSALCYFRNFKIMFAVELLLLFLVMVCSHSLHRSFWGN